MPNVSFSSSPLYLDNDTLSRKAMATLLSLTLNNGSKFTDEMWSIICSEYGQIFEQNIPHEVSCSLSLPCYIYFDSTSGIPTTKPSSNCRCSLPIQHPRPCRYLRRRPLRPQYPLHGTCHHSCDAPLSPLAVHSCHLYRRSSRF